MSGSVDRVLAYSVSVLIGLGFVALYAAIALRSFARNRAIYGRPPWVAGFIAFWAAWLWPLTLFYWAVGPTPERRRH